VSNHLSGSTVTINWRQGVKVRARFFIALAWAISLVSVGIWAQTKPHVEPPPGNNPPAGVLIGPVLSGADIGVRVAAQPSRDATIQGTVVVRINGQWVAVVPVSNPRLTPVGH
jgi:hypothetical protein